MHMNGPAEARGITPAQMVEHMHKTFAEPEPRRGMVKEELSRPEKS